MQKKHRIKLSHITKQYDLTKTKSDKIKAMLFNKHTESFWALRDVNLTIYDGEAIGLIGINGSGKSTLSNIISGVIVPTSGEVEVDGEVSLIAIQVGLKGPLTGLENIRLKLLMHGMTNKEINAKIPSIIDFADIGDFINQPIKNYSSGMKSRLGFAISVHLNPDILVIDEALSVGDQTFYQKCVDKINEFKARGKTIIFVSHSITQVKNLCDRIVWMHYGQVREVGSNTEIAQNYVEFVNWYNKLSKEAKSKYIKEHREGQKRGVGLSRIMKSPTKEKLSWKTMGGGILLALLTLFFAFLVGSGTSFIGLFTGEDQTATSEKVPIEQTKKKEKPATDDASKEGASEKAQQEQPAAATAQTYEVQAGDSLSGIAAKFYPNASVQTSVEKIKKANNLETDTINPGQILKIPA